MLLVGAGRSKPVNFHPGKVPICTDQEPNERYARSLEGHWIQCDQLPEFAPRHPLPRHMKDPLLDPTLLQIPRLTSPASKQHQAAAFNDV